MERRNILSGLALGPLVAGLGAASPAEANWGAIHFEDLITVTKTGMEPLATLSDPLIVI